jgi:site-specific recombinase XerD
MKTPEDILNEAIAGGRVKPIPGLVEAMREHAQAMETLARQPLVADEKERRRGAAEAELKRRVADLVTQARKADRRPHDQREGQLRAEARRSGADATDAEVRAQVFRHQRATQLAALAEQATTPEAVRPSRRKSDAERLLQKRVGAREHNLHIIKYAERLTFDTAAQGMIDDFVANKKRSLLGVTGRITRHLIPYFGGRRLVGITAADITAFVAHRQRQGVVAVKGPHTGARVRDVSNGELNRELQHLKRIFSLAVQSGRIATAPYIGMLRESNTRTGFFEPDQLKNVIAHLPVEIRPVIQFASVTGWRIRDEVLPLEWRQVDFQAGEVRLDPGTTKNDEGRTFPMTRDLRVLLETQRVKHERLKRAGHIMPRVFFRMVADKGTGGPKKRRPIKRFDMTWQTACRAAGCPGRIPHDLRRTAVRSLVRASIPERVCMQLTGHKTRSIFERYNIVSEGDLRDAAARLDATVALSRDKKPSRR